jgi:hypothetical protein
MTAKQRIKDEISALVRLLDKDDRYSKSNAQYLNGALFGLRYALHMIEAFQETTL